VKVRHRASIGVESPGRIVEIPHREGSTVRKGQLLLRVDDREERTALERSRREKATAEAELEATRHRCDLAEREAERLERLWNEGIASEEVADTARTAARQCQAELEAARERASLMAAAVAQAKVALEKTRVLAPFDGVVNRVLGEVGEWGLPGQAILELMEQSAPYVRAEIDEVDLAKVKEGLPVRITLDPFKDRRFEGTITRVASFVSEMELQNRTLEVDVAFADPFQMDALKPGTSADVEVILQLREDVLRVPTYTVLDGDRVLVVRGGGAESQPVEVGLRNWDWVEIVSGLQEGMPVIASLDKEGVEEGARVRIAGERER
jgi:HlyD family secretion protein